MDNKKTAIVQKNLSTRYNSIGQDFFMNALPREAYRCGIAFCVL